MPDPLSHHPAMLIIKPDSMPRFWWLVPWAYARQLHRNCVALKALCDRQDDLLRGRYTTRPRWEVVPHKYADGQVAYYFRDTDPELDRCKSTAVLRGMTMLYDGPSKAFVACSTAEAAIERLSELNAK